MVTVIKGLTGGLGLITAPVEAEVSYSFIVLSSRMRLVVLGFGS